MLDNLVVFLLPAYIIFEVRSDRSSDKKKECIKTLIYNAFVLIRL